MSTGQELLEQHQPGRVVTGLTPRNEDGVGLIKDFRKLGATRLAAELSSPIGI